VSPAGAIAIGAIAGGVCALLMSLRHRVGLDDRLGVVAIHLAGGAIGALLVGFLAVGVIEYGEWSHSFGAGLLYGGGLGQLGSQAVGVIAVAGYSFLVAWFLARTIDDKLGFRRPPR
jgi:Amt family ammonium transporter